ncbi:hypothetical protein C8R43DRAFT_959322 [Mycena crocata]|nr:hypothetical protein C8R43DRAFT_959322 [Mycena crocata]
MKLTLWALLKDQFTKQAPVAKADLAGKTVIVLGANTGLGFDASKHFARMNPGRLILACRSQSRGQAALDNLQKTTGYKKAELWLIDLSDFDSVKSFADKFEKDGGRLDILVENAAMMNPKFDATKYGWEMNCLATPLLPLLLLPHMLRTAKEHATLPRVVVVTSELHYWADIPKDIRESNKILATLGSAEFCTPKAMQTFYFITKLLNVLFVRALNARLGDAPLIVNAVNPGFCVSELRRGFTGVAGIFMSIMVSLLAFSTDEGSRRLVWGAVGFPEDPNKLRGQYLNHNRVDESSDFVISAEGQKFQNDTWNELIEMLGKEDPNVLATVDKYLA